MTLPQLLAALQQKRKRARPGTQHYLTLAARAVEAAIEYEATYPPEAVRAAGEEEE